jgi:nucleoside-diphosphate kinase
MTERTLVIFKPDAVKRKLVGRILQRFEDKGLTVTELHLRQLRRDTLADHYAEHSGKSFFSALIDSMMVGEVIVGVLEGNRAVEVVRRMVGDTDGGTAQPGTVRGDFASGSPLAENLVHASDSKASAAREICIFFGRCYNGG